VTRATGLFCMFSSTMCGDILIAVCDFPEHSVIPSLGAATVLVLVRL
jgi:hypothetical protein